MSKAQEISLAQTKQRRAVQLRHPADVMIRTRLELLAVFIAPQALRHIAAVDEDFLGTPVFRLPFQPAAPFDQQNALARRRESMGQRTAARARADDDDVIVGFHESSLGHPP